MSWGRGVSNNAAGELRMPSVPQFAEAIKRQAAAESRSEACTLVVRDLAGEDTTTYACVPEDSFARQILGSPLVPAPLESSTRTEGGAPETASLSAAKPILDALRRDGRAYIYTHGHPHFILRVSVRPDLSAVASKAVSSAASEGNGGVFLSEMQRINNHLCVSEPYEWRCFDDWRKEPALADVTLEVRHRFPAHWARRTSVGDDEEEKAPKAAVVAARGLETLLAKQLFGHIVTVNELFLVRYEGLELVCRLVDLEPEAEAEAEAESEAGPEAAGRPGGGDDEEEEARGKELVLPDNYRGMVEAETRVFLRVDDVCADTLELPGLVAKAAAPPAKDIVDVTTGADGEWFPVKKKLLRPCIALTAAVQAGRGVHAEKASAAAVPGVDCCTFDRVLLFLEATFRGLPFDVLPEHLEDMSAAADALKLQGLRDLCDKKRGAFESRVRRDAPIAFEEVVQRNAAGEVLLVMDGMVLDVTRWLEEHPGGSDIIPNQALDMDCTVFFEIYHVSRQSFLYLKEFYIGELREEDMKNKVPRGAGDPSPAFLEQLRAHTTWRLDFSAEAVGSRPHKSF